jgi:hypothetical protein
MATKEVEFTFSVEAIISATFPENLPSMCAEPRHHQGQSLKTFSVEKDGR